MRRLFEEVTKSSSLPANIMLVEMKEAHAKTLQQNNHYFGVKHEPFLDLPSLDKMIQTSSPECLKAEGPLTSVQLKPHTHLGWRYVNFNPPLF